MSKEAYQQVLYFLEGAEYKLSRYVELSVEGEDLLNTTQAEALNKKTSDSQRQHCSKLMILRVKIAKKAPQENKAKPKVRVGYSQGRWEKSSQEILKSHRKL